MTEAGIEVENLVFSAAGDGFYNVDFESAHAPGKYTLRFEATGTGSYFVLASSNSNGTAVTMKFNTPTNASTLANPYIRLNGAEPGTVAEYKTCAFDNLWYDDRELVSAKAYLWVHDPANAEALDFMMGTVSTITFRGWAQVSTAVLGFGYQIDDKDMVLGEFIEDRSAELTEAGFPGGQGYVVPVPVDELKLGKHTIKIFVIADDGSSFPIVKTKDGVDYPVEIEFNVTENPDISVVPAAIHDKSFNTVWVDGNLVCDVDKAIDYLAENPISGDIKTIGLRGWAWLDNAEIYRFGYKIDGGEAVLNSSYTQERADVQSLFKVTAAEANGYNINPIDVSGLKNGAHTITVVVKADDNSVLEIAEVPFTIDRDAVLPPTDFSDYFGDDHRASEWKMAGGPKVENGVLTLGIPQGNWTSTGYQAYISTERVNYKAPHVIEFKAAVSNFGSCYTGFGLRGADYKDENGNLSCANFNNGTRWGLGTESANGIAVDLFVPQARGYMGLSFEDGTTGGDQPYAIFKNPEGFNVFEEHTYTIKDYGDTIEAFIDGEVFFKIVFSGLADGKYTNAVVTDRNGDIQWTGAVSANESGYFGFYQRDAGITVSEVTIKGITEEEALVGDVNGDGSVNNKDVMALFQFVSESLKEGETFIEANADVNGDGSVNNKDVMALFKLISEG